MTSNSYAGYLTLELNEFCIINSILLLKNKWNQSRSLRLKAIKITKWAEWEEERHLSLIHRFIRIYIHFIFINKPHLSHIQRNMFTKFYFASHSATSHLWFYQFLSSTSTVSTKVEHTQINSSNIYQKDVGGSTKHSQYIKHSIRCNCIHSTNH